MTVLQVPGIDLVETADVAASIDRFGATYLERVFHARELAATEGMADARRLDFLAGRLAAKEAVLKALRVPSGASTPWTDIIIERSAQGWPLVLLAGEVAQLAADRGCQGIDISISHEGGRAAACAIAHLTSIEANTAEGDPP